MNVLFLDIDGVLNSTASVMASIGNCCMSPYQRAELEVLKLRFKNEDGALPYGPTFTVKTIDPVSVGLMNRLIRETDSRIVLSSTHRSYFVRDGGCVFGTEDHLAVLRLYLNALGLLGSRLYGITAQHWGQRGEEVQQFIENHNGTGDGSIERYAIVDDGTDFLPGQPLIWVDPSLGFGFKEYQAASLALGGSTSLIITADDVDTGVQS